MQKFFFNFITTILLGFSITICFNCDYVQSKKVVEPKIPEKDLILDSIPEIKNRNSKKIIEALIANDDSLAKNLNLLKLEGNNNTFILDFTQKYHKKKNRHFINKYNSDFELLYRSEICSGIYVDRRGNDFEIDKNDNMYISGVITSDIIYQGDTLIRNSKGLGFLSKLDKNGKLSWITKLPESYDGAHSRIFINDSAKNVSILTYSNNTCDSCLISYNISENGKILNYKKFLSPVLATFSEISLDQKDNLLIIYRTNKGQLNLVRFDKNRKEFFDSKSKNARSVGLLNSITQNDFIYISGWMEGWKKKEFKFQNKKIENLEDKNCLFIAKLDLNGQCIWIKSIDSNAGQFGDLEIIDNKLFYSFLSYNSTELFLNLVELNQEGIIIKKHKDFLEYKDNLVSIWTEVSNSNTVSIIGLKVEKKYVDGKQEKQYTSVAGRIIFNE